MIYLHVSFSNLYINKVNNLNNYIIEDNLLFLLNYNKYLVGIFKRYYQLSEKVNICGSNYLR